MASFNPYKEVLGSVHQVNSPELDQRIHDVSQMIRKAYKARDYKRMEKLKKDLKKLESKNEQAKAWRRESIQNEIKAVISFWGIK